MEMPNASVTPKIELKTVKIGVVAYVLYLVQGHDLFISYCNVCLDCCSEPFLHIRDCA